MKRGMRFVGVLTALAIVMATTFVRPAQMSVGLPAASGAKVDPALTGFLSAKAPGTETAVVISYSHQPTALDFSRLQSAGIFKGYVCQQLPMVIADMNLTQLGLVRAQSGVKSIWAWAAPAKAHASTAIIRGTIAA